MADIRVDMEQAVTNASEALRACADETQMAERKADKRKNLEAEYEAKLTLLLEEVEKARGESEDR